MRNFSSRRLCASQQHWIFKLVCQFFNCLPWCSLHTSVSLWSCHYWTAAQSRPLLQRACIIAYLPNEFEALVANWSRWLSCPPLRHYPHISSDRCGYINIITTVVIHRGRRKAAAACPLGLITSLTSAEEAHIAPRVTIVQRDWKTPMSTPRWGGTQTERICFYGRYVNKLAINYNSINQCD